VEGEGEIQLLLSPQSSAADSEAWGEASMTPRRDYLFELVESEHAANSAGIAMVDESAEHAKLCQTGSGAHLSVPCHYQQAVERSRAQMKSTTVVRSPHDVLWLALGIFSFCLLLVFIWSSVVLAAVAVWSLIRYWIWLPVLYWTLVGVVAMYYLTACVTAAHSKALVWIRMPTLVSS